MKKKKKCLPNRKLASQSFDSMAVVTAWPFTLCSTGGETRDLLTVSHLPQVSSKLGGVGVVLSSSRK